jgi:hypothetical protein
MGQLQASNARLGIGSSAPSAVIPALAPERGSSTLKSHSGPHHPIRGSTKKRTFAPNFFISFDNLGAGEDGWRDCEAERLRGLQVDDKVKVRRSLDRQLAR